MISPGGSIRHSVPSRLSSSILSLLSSSVSSDRSGKITEVMDCEESLYSPNIVLIFSGKRKSGKDYVTERLFERLPPADTALMHLSAPIKREFAEAHGLDYEKLLTASAYKEQYRGAMLEWSEDLRRQDSGCFIRPAIAMEDPDGEKKIWIIADARRKSDMEWLRENLLQSSVKTILIRASLDTREKRGWVFTSGIDDAETECGLDDVTDWDLIIDNDGDEEELQKKIDKIVDMVFVRLNRLHQFSDWL